MARLTYTNEELAKEISMKVDDYAIIDDILEDNIIPMLLAIGYKKEVIEECIRYLAEKSKGECNG